MNQKQAKLSLLIHRLALLFCIVLWAIGLAESSILILGSHRTFLYPLAATVAASWLSQRMADHCKWFKHAIGLIPIIEAAKSIPFPDALPKHRNIRYVQKHKVKKY